MFLLLLLLAAKQNPARPLLRTLSGLVFRNDAFNVLEVILCTCTSLLVVGCGVRDVFEYVRRNNLLWRLAGAGESWWLVEGGEEFLAVRTDLAVSQKRCLGSLADLFGVASRVGNGLQEMGRDDIAALVAHGDEYDVGAAVRLGRCERRRNGCRMDGDGDGDIDGDIEAEPKENERRRRR